jgi:pimeloyl-ACP methyl ester carboxylesterase
MEYLPMVQYLTKPQMGQRNQTVSYDVIIPSLPGYGFSSLPSASWTIEDTARVFNELMVDVLGYKTYTLFGSDQGSVVTYDMYTAYPEHVKAAYFVFLPSQAPSLAELAAENITLTPYEQAGAERAAAWSQTGDGYFIGKHPDKPQSAFANPPFRASQSGMFLRKPSRRTLTDLQPQPNTIGQALYDSPVGQLAWIAEKFFVLSDPNNPIANSTVLAHVSLYFLSRSFLSAVWMYTHNSFYRSYASPPTAPMGFSAFKYNPGQVASSSRDSRDPSG